MRIAGPATEQTWVGDADGDPVMVLTAAPSQSLAAKLHRLLPDLRALVGPDRRCTVVFDRGYSPAVFSEIITAGFDLLTYFKGSWAKSPVKDFTTVNYTAPYVSTHSYELAERPIELPVSGYRATADQPAAQASSVTLRLTIRRSPNGHQTPILTNRADLTLGEITYRMSNRWRQENYFKYAREHFSLDALDSYADHQDDLTRLVPNPAKAKAIGQVTGARSDLTAAQADMTQALDAAVKKTGSAATAARPPSILPRAWRCAKPRTTSHRRARPPATPPRTCPWVTSGPAAAGSKPNASSSRTRSAMSAYNSESALARLLRPHYSRGDDEARALLREAFTLPGDP